MIKHWQKAPPLTAVQLFLLLLFQTRSIRRAAHFCTSSLNLRWSFPWLQQNFFKMTQAVPDPWADSVPRVICCNNARITTFPVPSPSHVVTSSAISLKPNRTSASLHPGTPRSPWVIDLEHDWTHRQGAGANNSPCPMQCSASIPSGILSASPFNCFLRGQTFQFCKCKQNSSERGGCKDTQKKAQGCYAISWALFLHQASFILQIKADTSQKEELWITLLC